jgi:hypothetical protein
MPRDGDPEITASMPSVPAQSDLRRLSAGELIEQRFGTIGSARELAQLVEIRGEIIRQDEAVEARRHKRRLESIESWSKIVGRLSAIAIGTTMIFVGDRVLGAFILGIGLYFVAPSFVGRFFSKATGGDA